MQKQTFDTYNSQKRERVQPWFVLIVNVLVKLISLPIITILLAFTFRRILFALAILFVKRSPASGGNNVQNRTGEIDFLILVPCRDEEEMIPGICYALERMDYPKEHYQVVLVDDASQDHTGGGMRQCAAGKTGWHVVSLEQNAGKASALNQAIAKIPFGEVLYVFDADHRPNPDILRKASRYFQDPEVAGVSGRTIPVNPLASSSSYYSTVENYIHQLVTMRAKDRLRLAPALLGSNCGYRRQALEKCGGFRRGALLEDSDLTLSFYQAGYTVRFIEEAAAYQQVPETVSGYLKQHARWARGFQDVTRDHSYRLLLDHRLSAPLRLELFLFSTGYLDRFAFAGAAALTGLSLLSRRLFGFPRWLLALSFFTPLAQIIALFWEQKVPPDMWLRLPLIPAFFLLDMLAAGKGMLDSLLNRTPVWTKTLRSDHTDLR